MKMLRFLSHFYLMCKLRESSMQMHWNPVHTYSICWTHTFGFSSYACSYLYLGTAACIERLEYARQRITEQTACIQINVIAVSMKLFRAARSLVRSFSSLFFTVRVFLNAIESACVCVCDHSLSDGMIEWQSEHCTKQDLNVCLW